MEMSELKNGDEVYVSDISHKKALKGKANLTYIGMAADGRHVVEKVSGLGVNLGLYKFCVKVPEKELVPFDQDTFPKGVVYLRTEGDVFFYIAGGIGLDRVEASGGDVRFSELVDTWEISTNLCKTWQKAGVEK